MDMVLVGDEAGRATAGVPDRQLEATDPPRATLVLPSLEVAGPGGHWVEVSRAIKAGGEPNDGDPAHGGGLRGLLRGDQGAMRAGVTAHELHRAVSKGFTDRGYKLGHVTGHSIGMTMIEFPKVGEGVETLLEQNMVLSVHPHVISEDGLSCLYMQETWLVTRGRRRAALESPHADLRRLGVPSRVEWTVPRAGACVLRASCAREQWG